MPMRTLLAFTISLADVKVLYLKVKAYDCVVYHPLGIFHLRIALR